MNNFTENQIAEIVVGSAYKIHAQLGPGLLESVYEECLEFELKKATLEVKRQQAFPVIYESIKLDAGYRIDLLVNDKLIVEVKAVQEMNDIFFAQTLTYLRLTGCKLGLLINFNVPKIKFGIRRIVNNL